MKIRDKINKFIKLAKERGYTICSGAYVKNIGCCPMGAVSVVNPCLDICKSLIAAKHLSRSREWVFGFTQGFDGDRKRPTSPKGMAGFKLGVEFRKILNPIEIDELK